MIQTGNWLYNTYYTTMISPRQLHNQLTSHSSPQYYVAASSVYSLAYFQPIIMMNGMGFDYVKTQLLSTPLYVDCQIASLELQELTAFTCICHLREYDNGMYF